MGKKTWIALSVIVVVLVVVGIVTLLAVSGPSGMSEPPPVQLTFHPLPEVKNNGGEREMVSLTIQADGKTTYHPQVDLLIQYDGSTATWQYISKRLETAILGHCHNSSNALQTCQGEDESLSKIEELRLTPDSQIIDRVTIEGAREIAFPEIELLSGWNHLFLQIEDINPELNISDQTLGIEFCIQATMDTKNGKEKWGRYCLDLDSGRMVERKEENTTTTLASKSH